MEGHPMLTPVYELADGDKDFLKEILESIATNVPEDIKQIEEAIKGKQLHIICKAAHHMKSSVMYTNTDELKELLTQIETSKEAPGVIDQIKELIPKLELFTSQLLEIIETERGKQP
jgi:HPt (histidine-containing phosphotransfer) domain-containing protein